MVPHAGWAGGWPCSATGVQCAVFFFFFFFFENVAVIDRGGLCLLGGGEEGLFVGVECWYRSSPMSHTATGASTPSPALARSSSGVARGGGGARCTSCRCSTPCAHNAKHAFDQKWWGHFEQLWSTAQRNLTEQWVCMFIESVLPTLGHLFCASTCSPSPSAVTTARHVSKGPIDGPTHHL